ncbi:MAG: ABC transporter permease [Acholeplasmataceae bacterium]
MFNRIKKHVDIFQVLSIVIGLLIIIPLINIGIQVFEPRSETWLHIRTYLLSEYIFNTVILIIGVAIISSLFGLFLAYAVVRYDFKSKGILRWMLILPLALPSYIAAYVYADMISYTGTIARMLKMIGFEVSLNMMHMGGAIFIFVFTLFPYVYVLTMSALVNQSASYLESATSLGASRTKAFFTVTLPLIRPALVAGVLLTVLETLNDYGVVSYFNVRVFSFAIFNAWFNLNDISSAIRLSAYLMGIVLIIILVERALRGKKRYHMHVKTRPIKSIQIKGFKLWFVLIVAWGTLAVGFIIPVLQLIWYATLTIRQTLTIELLYVTLNTLTISATAAFMVVAFAIILANFNRLKPNTIKKSWLRLTNLGYAIPGAVIAIAVHVFFISLDRTLYPVYRLFNQNTPVLVLSLSLVMLTFAYMLRFMAIGYNSIESSYDKIGKQFTEAGYVLNSSKINALFRIDMPLLKSGIISAFILVFIDIIKELPLTLILRPPNYNTLATMVYVYASDEMIQESSLAALILIMISAVFIYIFTHSKKKGKHVYVRPIE